MWSDGAGEGAWCSGVGRGVRVDGVKCHSWTPKWGLIAPHCLPDQKAYSLPKVRMACNYNNSHMNCTVLSSEGIVNTIQNVKGRV